MKTFFLSSLLLAAACAQPEVAPPRTASHERPERPIYRLDFVLAARDAAGPTRNTAFSLQLEEGDRGEVLVGRNVPLQATPTTVAPRQDVGLRVQATCFARADDVFLDVNTEMSAFEAPDIRKIVARGNALAAIGKSTIVTSLDDDAKHYQLSVTPTRLR